MTDIIDKAIETAHPGHQLAAYDHLEYHRNLRDSAGSVGFEATARSSAARLEDARERLDRARTESPETVFETRRNRTVARLTPALEGRSGSDSELETTDDTTPVESTEIENPDGAMFYRRGDRYDSQSHRGL